MKNISYIDKVPKEDELKCIICNDIFENAKARNIHIKQEHGLTYEQYIMKHYFNNKYPKCKCGCGYYMPFVKTPFGIWFRDFRKNHFPRKSHTEETNQKIKENTTKAIKEKFGVDNVMQLDEYRDKIKETKLERYGDENYNSPNLSKSTKITCKLCNFTCSIMGIAGHIRHSHDMTVDEYVKSYGEYRPKKLLHEYKRNTHNITCKICNNKFISEKELSYHIKSTHNIPKMEYVTKYIWNNEPQLCKCGCNIPVTLLTYFPYRRKYLPNHEPNGMLGKLHTQESIHKMKKSAINRSDIQFNKNTDIELLFMKMLIENEIKHKHQYKTEFGIVDFYLPDTNEFVEIDGDYWHQLELVGINIKQLSTAVNDYNKDTNIPNLIRIFGSNVPKIKSYHDIHDHKYNKLYNTKFYDKIIEKKFFKEYIELKGKDKLKRYLYIFRKFIRTFQPTFPIVPQTESITDVVSTIHDYDLSRVQTDNIFSGNCYHIGNNLLKSNFVSFWKSANKGKLSPTDAWKDDDIMSKIIEYRIGINNSNEIFDFSLHQLVTGLASNKFTVSFFKPLLAASIYDELLSNKPNPTVIDPCSGFGGRMLGFISRFQQGTYIGIEPNEETFNELMELRTKLVNELGLDEKQIQLHNCKFEDYVHNGTEYDLVFTSIPYFDLETYSTEMKYDSIASWKTTFIDKFYEYDNVYVNMNQKLYDKLKLTDNIDYYISNNTFHFNRSDSEKRLKTSEIICKFE